jgi:dihydrofolate synthase/folylpolyglutamate synthase
MIDLYPELIDKLFNINKHNAVKSGLDNISRLNKFFGFPDRNFKSILVAGTNGKGSVTVKMGKALELAGYRVGVFTSPHISSFRERIQINGELISEKDVVEHLLELFQTIEKHRIPATFFELTTMLSFNYFASKGVDWAVIETGLGGRFDATNIILPELSVITSISLDHEDILGNTLEKIAFEKAGIIKPGIPIVLGPRTPFIPRRIPFYEVNGSFDTTEEENREIAKKGIEILKIPLDPAGLKARLPCRMERFHIDGVEVILDVAHNPDALFHLLNTLKGKPLRLVFGMSKTKDITKCVEIVKNHLKHVHLVEVPEGRGHPVNVMQEAFFPVVPEVAPSIEEGIRRAISIAQSSGETVLICGSCYTMGASRNFVTSCLT